MQTTTYYTQSHSDLLTQNQRNINESKATHLLYNGALDKDDDPADYYPYIKAVSIA